MSAAKELEIEGIAWGPAAHRGEHELSSDALALAVKNVSRTGIPSYTIVLRGTNPVSLSSWLFQDLDVAGMVPWTRCSPDSVESNAWVSKGTDRAVALINGLETDQLVAGGAELGELGSRAGAARGKGYRHNGNGPQFGWTPCARLRGVSARYLAGTGPSRAGGPVCLRLLRPQCRERHLCRLYRPCLEQEREGQRSRRLLLLLPQPLRHREHSLGGRRRRDPPGHLRARLPNERP